MSQQSVCNASQLKHSHFSLSLTCKTNSRVNVKHLNVHLLLQGQTGPRMHDLSPEPVVHLSQHKLLPLMLHRAQRLAGQDSIRFGHHLQLFQQSPAGVTSWMQPLQVCYLLPTLPTSCAPDTFQSSFLGSHTWLQRVPSSMYSFSDDGAVKVLTCLPCSRWAVCLHALPCHYLPQPLIMSF